MRPRRAAEPTTTSRFSPSGGWLGRGCGGGVTAGPVVWWLLAVADWRCRTRLGADPDSPRGRCGNPQRTGVSSRPPDHNAVVTRRCGGQNFPQRRAAFSYRWGGPLAVSGTFVSTAAAEHCLPPQRREISPAATASNHDTAARRSSTHRAPTPRPGGAGLRTRRPPLDSAPRVSRRSWPDTTRRRPCPRGPVPLPGAAARHRRAPDTAGPRPAPRPPRSGGRP